MNLKQETMTLNPISPELHSALPPLCAKIVAHQTSPKFIACLDDHIIVITVFMKGTGCDNSSNLKIFRQ